MQDGLKSIGDIPQKSIQTVFDQNKSHCYEQIYHNQIAMNYIHYLRIIHGLKLFYIYYTFHVIFIPACSSNIAIIIGIIIFAISCRSMQLLSKYLL